MCGYYGSDNDGSVSLRDVFNGVIVPGADEVLEKIREQLDEGKVVMYRDEKHIAYTKADTIVTKFLNETSSKDIMFTFQGLSFVLAQKGDSNNREMMCFDLVQLEK
ncbi:MAG: hypothetical protein ACRC92_26305 [Peptostreptococcaceae bacterium]